MNNRFTALLGAVLLWITASGFAHAAPPARGGDTLDRGVDALNEHVEEAGRWLYAHAKRVNRAITPLCLALAIAIAGWRLLRGRSNGEGAANAALYLLLSALLILRAPEIFLHPAKGLLPNAAQLAANRLARLSPEGARGKNARQWWRHWLGSLDDPGGGKLSPTYAQERVLGFPEGGGRARRYLIDQARRALTASARQDLLPGKKLDNALNTLLLLAERKSLRLLLFLSLALLGIAFFLLSGLQLLFCGASTFLWELTMAAALVALPGILVGFPVRHGRTWLRLFLIASLVPILWSLLAALSYLGLTTLFASVLGERGLFSELRETGGEWLRGLASKRSLLLVFWSLTPELPRMIFLGLYEMMGGLIGYCTVAITVCSTLFLGAVLPLAGLWHVLRRSGSIADSLLAGWLDLHREIAIAATALGAFLAEKTRRLAAEEPAPTDPRAGIEPRTVDAGEAGSGCLS